MASIRLRHAEPITSRTACQQNGAAQRQADFADRLIGLSNGSTCWSGRDLRSQCRRAERVRADLSRVPARLVFGRRDRYLSGMATVLQRSRAARDPEALKPAIRARAQELGFDVVGFAAPGLPRPIQRAYRRYIAAG